MVTPQRKARGKPQRTVRRLDLRSLEHLRFHLGLSPRQFAEVREVPETFYRFHTNPDKKGKLRHYATPIGPLLVALRNLNRLFQRLDLPDCLHGGRKGRSSESNARVHARSHVLFQTDLKDFFPNVSHRQVYRYFTDVQGCSPDVASAIMKLVTVRGSLPQGSPTSTIVAALVSSRLARRINGLARSRGGVMSQYVDDITVSGSSSIRRIVSAATKIIENEGFRAHPTKTKIVESDKERVVTGLRVGNGLDVPSQSIDSVRELIERSGGVQTVSVDAKIKRIARYNPGVAQTLRRQLRRVGTLATKGIRRIPKK